MKEVILKPFKQKTTEYLEDKDGERFDVIQKRGIRDKFLIAISRNSHLKVFLDENGNLNYKSRKIKSSDELKPVSNFPELEQMKIEQPKVPKNDTIKFLDTAYSLKPNHLKMSELKWKTLIHDVIQGSNIMMTGPSGTGKTFAVQSIAKAFEEKRSFFYFNLGASQDPRVFLIGNTHFNKEKGTYFNRSAFVKAITTENAIILLDEVSRAHPDAWNILMTILDEGQKYLRIDEAEDTPVINVAKGVAFLATANIGNEYTSTRVMDHALIERFEIMRMEPLDKKDEMEMLRDIYPNIDKKIISNIAEIAEITRKEVKLENGKISKILSSRSTKKIAQMISNGFTLLEAAEVRIYPYYDDEGGADSELTFMKQLIQKFCKSDEAKNEDVFNVDDNEVLDDDKPF